MMKILIVILILLSPKTFAADTYSIPDWLMHIQRVLPSRMTKEKAQPWREKFLNSIPPNQDLNVVRPKLIRLIMSKVIHTFNHENNPDVVAAIRLVMRLYMTPTATRADFRKAYYDANRAMGEASKRNAFNAVKAAQTAETASTALLVPERVMDAIDDSIDPNDLAGYDVYGEKILELMKETKVSKIDFNFLFQEPSANECSESQQGSDKWPL